MRPRTPRDWRAGRAARAGRDGSRRTRAFEHAELHRWDLDKSVQDINGPFIIGPLAGRTPDLFVSQSLTFSLIIITVICNACVV